MRKVTKPRVIHPRKVRLRKPPPREESVIFEELAALCASRGYAEAIAALCLRDDAIPLLDGELTGQAIRDQYSRGALSRTEISTLIGLLVRQPVDHGCPSNVQLASYIQQTDSLMDELHRTLSFQFARDFDPSRIDDPSYRPMASGTLLREAFFYGGDSAYEFQYRDFAVRKYEHDDEWLSANRGFSIEVAAKTVHAIRKIQLEKVRDTLFRLARASPEDADISPVSAFILTVDEVAKEVSLAPELVQTVFDAFTFPESDRNPSFKTLQDFNGTIAAPLIAWGGDRYVLFQAYTLAEALYEAPFFWMCADRAYFPKATINRGKFTEDFAADCLERVFGSAYVHRNVFLPTQKGRTRTEIDALVTFGNRAIVVQAKSKRLTIEAKKGNELQIQDDFKKAVQDACNQAMACSKALLEPGCKLEDNQGNSVLVSGTLKQVFPICVVADHYPALTPQVREFLKFDATNVIATPLATDIFALDVMTEMLCSPLRFLSYLQLRARFGEKINAMNELTVLGTHLSQNLWVDDQYDMVMLDESLAANMDAAMMVRREEAEGPDTPEGILTRFRGTTIEKFLTEIEEDPHPVPLDLGLLLLELSGDALKAVSHAWDSVIEACRRDLQPHNATIGFHGGDGGITLQGNYLPDQEARIGLTTYCARRKYAQKANQWFGLLLDPDTGKPRFVIGNENKWAHDPEMDRLVAGMAQGTPFRGKWPNAKTKKPGRNDPCPCGSGRKYKHCCL